jgi:predicted RNA binding protein YcfA (HicA-like mRNA interferase family)
VFNLILKNMKFSELYRLLEENGWVKKKGKKHIKYVHPDFSKPIPVGRHPAQEVPTGTLEAILREAGLK